MPRGGFHAVAVPDRRPEGSWRSAAPNNPPGASRPPSSTASSLFRTAPWRSCLSRCRWRCVIGGLARLPCHLFPGCLNSALSAAIEDVHRCGGELCALARVNMIGTQEPSRSSDDDSPQAAVTSYPPSAPGPRESLVEAHRVDPRRSASRLGVRRIRPCARDVPRPGRGTVRHAAAATVPRHSRGGVCGSTRPAPGGRSPYRPAEAATRPPRRRRGLGALPDRP